MGQFVILVYTMSQKNVACLLIFYKLKKPELIIIDFGTQYHDNPSF